MQGYEVGNSRYIHDLNQAGIFKMIYKMGPVSRKELSENTGYSAATISNHVKILLEEEFVIETEKGSSTGGRRPVYLTVNPEKGYILSVDIEVNLVKIVMFNLQLKIEMESYFPLTDKNNPEITLDKIKNKIQEIMDSRNLKEEKILGMGIGVPGLINRSERKLEFAPNLGWTNLDIIGFFESEYNFPIILENEAKAAVMGEREFIYPDIDNLVFVSINEGIGCGIVLNGELYRGVSGNAGEFGHITINSEGPECHCGNHGCWEAMASENFIIDQYQDITGLDVKEKEQIYPDNGEVSSPLLKIYKETAVNIGIGLANIVNSLSPKLLVIGGDITQIKDYIEEDINNVLAERSVTVSYKYTDLRFSKLKNLAVVHGLASFVFDQCIGLLRR